MAKKINKVGIEECQMFGRTCVVYNLRRASRVVTQLYEDQLKPSRLLPTQFALLAAVRVMGPVAMSKIAKEMVLDRTTLTRNIKPLVRDGMLSVDYIKNDKRLRHISITKKGMKKLEQAIPYWKKAQNVTKKLLSSNRFDRILEDLRETVAAASKAA